MATQFDNGYASLAFASSVSANSIVAMTSTDNTATAGVTAGTSIGVLQQDVTSGQVGSVKLFFPSQFAITDDSVVAGNTVYQAGAGHVSTTGSVAVGVVRSASATSSTIEVFITR